MRPGKIQKITSRERTRKMKKIKMYNEEGFTYKDRGACSAKGFKANGMHTGIHPDPDKNDLMILFSDEPCNTAAVYTTNKVKGAPIIVTKENLERSGGISRAVIANCKNANTCNKDGVEKAGIMCEEAARALNIKSEEVIVASTGVIGAPFDVTPVKEHIDELVKNLSAENHLEAEKAVMTTDTEPKEYAVSYTFEGKEITVGGMAKGSGMIHPNMATTLNFITSDVNITTGLLQKALSETVKYTYNCMSIDGDTSTNDMVSVMANKMAGNDEITDESEEGYKLFKKALYIVMKNLTRMLAADGEGAGKLVECYVNHAQDYDTAITLAKSVIGSSLVKCMIFGSDANWGRVLCAMGYSGAEVDINKIDVDFENDKGRVHVCEGGYGVPFSEEKAKEILSEDEIRIVIDIHSGECEATAWGCDLTYDYVKINGDYRS